VARVKRDFAKGGGIKDRSNIGIRAKGLGQKELVSLEKIISSGLLV